MRVGLLAFGEPLTEIAPLMDTLRERDIDVVAPLDEPATIREQALRLGRADCDGVIFAVGAGGDAFLVAEAALHTGCPILLVGNSGPAQVEAWNVLAALPLLFDALSPAEATADTVMDWLGENGKTSRQRGEEAVAKLYGMRLFTNADGASDFAARMQWLTQFGVLVSGDAPNDPHDTDLFATDTTPVDALTQRLLKLVSGSTDALSVDTSAFSSASGTREEPTFTFFQIAEYLPRRFSAFLFRGRATPNEGVYAIGLLPFNTLESNSKSPRFSAAAGDCAGAMRAACHALDIAVHVLHDK